MFDVVFYPLPPGELNNALHLHLLDLKQVLEIIRRKPPPMHLILTGRDAHPQVIEPADTVSRRAHHERKKAHLKSIT